MCVEIPTGLDKIFFAVIHWWGSPQMSSIIIAMAASNVFVARGNFEKKSTHKKHFFF